MSIKQSRKPVAVLLATILAATISGCATTEYIYVKPIALPLPNPPALPSIAPESLNCITDETYSALVERDAKRKAYADELKAIIGSTHD